MDWTRGCTIGQGSSATVSLATSCRSGDKFAVKSVQVSQSEFLQREQKIHSVLSSPHVVSYMGHDITSENNKLMYNLLMEYVPGGSIIDAIRSRGGLVDESMIRNYTRGIVKGLDYLHSLGLVHCDIKGRNILAGDDGPKIADFGCARWAHPAVASAATIGGTPMFMAPEVACGKEQGFACDVWALGCTIIEMATGGSAPWPKAADPVTVLYQIAYSMELPEIPSFLSEQAKHFLEKCLRRDPTERWTASQLLKHSFLGQEEEEEEEEEEVLISSCKITKQVQESNSCSPTSILDQDIWNSLGESETSGSLDENPSFENSSDDQRIRRLSLFSGDPRWCFDDESWITVRENDWDESNSIEDDAEGVGSEKDLDLDFLDSNNISCRINVDILEACKKSRRNSISVRLSNPILERDRDNLLLPSISSFW